MQRHEARRTLAQALRRDANLHCQEAFSSIGVDYDQLESQLSNSEEPDPEVGMAVTFWDSWIDERNHGFPGFYPGISKDTWPELAVGLADYLENKAKALDPLVESYFKYVPKMGLWKKLLTVLGLSRG